MDVFTLVGKISIDIQNALTDIQSVIGKVQELEGLLNGTQTTTQQMGGTVVQATEDATKKTGNTFNKWSVMMGNLATQAVNKVYGAGKSFMQTGYEYNALVETGVAHMATLLQTSTEDATAFFREIEQFSIDTPLSLTGTLETVTSMFGVGVGRDEMIDTMQMLGDIALGDTEKMKGLAKALTDVRGNTTLLAQDARQFTERGVPIWELLEKYYTATEGTYAGWSAGDLRAANRQKTPIPYEDVLAALQMATSPGGMYYNAMDTAMGTAEGQAERMLDQYQRTAGQFVSAFFDVFSSDILPALTNFFNQLNDLLAKNPEALTTLAEAIGYIATTGLDLLIKGLTGIIDFWNTNKAKIDAINAGQGEYGEDGTVWVGPVPVVRPDAEGEGLQYDENGKMDLNGYDPMSRFLMNFIGLFDGSSEWITKDNTLDEWKSRESTFSLPGEDGKGGSTSNNPFYASLQAVVAQIRSEVSAGAQEGVAAGLSGVTITGNVTTGNVTLDTGAIVGQIAPRMNLVLGGMNSMSGRG